MSKTKSKNKPKSSSAKKAFAATGLAGTLLLTSGSQSIKALPEKPPELRLPSGLVTSQEIKKLLSQSLSEILPKTQRLLTQKEEEKLAQTINRILGLKVACQLENNRLNHVYGRIGLEQHLPRYPGDSLVDRSFPQAGITQSTGAWGYFAPDKASLTTAKAQMEKYYVAVQTLYLKDWASRTKELSQWYKYRKVLVLNPQTGSAVVAVIADAGPAQWTGKQFGGSPQVMHDLNFYPKQTSGSVVLLFINDPQNQVPLGPIDYPLPQKPPQTT